MTDAQYSKILDRFDALIECGTPYSNPLMSPAVQRIFADLVKRGWVQKVGYEYIRTPEGTAKLKEFL